MGDQQAPQTEPTTSTNGHARPARPGRAEVLSELATLDSKLPKPAADPDDARYAFDFDGQMVSAPAGSPDGEDEYDDDGQPVGKPKAAASDDLDDLEDDGDDGLDDDDDLDIDEPRKKPTEDPEVDRRLSAVQKQAKREREAIARERELVAKEREELRDLKAHKEQFERLRARVKYDPTGVLMMLGLADDDLEPAAKHVYSRSKAAAADPKNREAVDAAMRDREAREELQALTKKFDEFKSSITEEKTRAQAIEEANRFLDNTARIAAKHADKAPLTKLHLEKAPARAKAAMAEVAFRIAQETGENPTPGRVIRAYEKQRRAELEELGVDIDALVKAPAKKPGAPAGVARRPAGTTAAAKDTAPSPAPTPAKAQTREEKLAELKRDLARQQRREELAALERGD